VQRRYTEKGLLYIGDHFAEPECRLRSRE